MCFQFREPQRRRALARRLAPARDVSCAWLVLFLRLGDIYSARGFRVAVRAAFDGVDVHCKVWRVRRKREVVVFL